MKKVNFLLSCAASLMLALSFTSCEFDSKDNSLAASKTKVSSAEEFIAAVQKGGVVELAPNVGINLSEAIEIPAGKDVAIIGDAKAPATFYGNVSFIVSRGFTLKNVEIDASESTLHLIQFNKTPDESLKTESGQYLIKQPILLENVVLKDFVKCLFYDNDKAYAFDNVTVNNCIIGLGDVKNVTLNFNKSMPITFNITNSTFYCKSSDKNFAAISGKRAWQITGYEEKQGLINIQNCTFYNIANKKQFINTNTLKGQANEIYRFQKNIFVNCGNKQIWDKITNGNNTIEVADNTYWYDGADAGEKYDKEVLTTDPNFKNAAAGNFTPQGAEQVAKKTGDPRWL